MPKEPAASPVSQPPPVLKSEGPVQNNVVADPVPAPRIETSTLSIKDALNSLGKNKSYDIKNNGIDGDAIDLSQEEQDIDYTSVSGEDILLVWRSFIDSIKSNETRMINALRNQEPIFESETGVITILLRNKALVAEFKENFKASLVTFLTEKLNIEFEISEKVIETDESPQTKYYTDIDKLKYMIEKNPAVAKLKQDFNLDFE